MPFRCVLLMTIAVLLAPYGACSYSQGGHTGGVDTVLSPPDATTGHPVDAEVTAEFSDEIQVPDDWADFFTLKKGGSGDNLCTDYSYDDGRHIASCIHDDLELNTAYQTLVTGLLAVNGAAALWSTEDGQ